MLKKFWYWILFKNPGGVVALLTILSIAIMYSLASFLGLIEGNVPLVLRYCGVAGVLLFIFMPLLNKLNK